MVTDVIVCGDSFGCGSGIDPETCFEQSFGSLVAAKYNLPYKIYARSGCCNYIILLQVQKVIEDYRRQRDKIPLVLITTTHHSRFVIPTDHAGTGYNNYTLEDVDYTLYEPYHVNSDYRREIPFTTKGKPKLISETISNFNYYYEGNANNLEYLFSNVKNKLSAIDTYYKEIYDDSIKQTYDAGLILQMHHLLKEANFPHIIMSANTHQERFIDQKNYLNNNWGIYSQKYPDKYRSGHCDERGHREVADAIISKLEEK
jgi:hypothetical protein